MSRRASYTLPMFDAPPIIETPPTKLRPYQDRALRLARMHIDAGIKRLILVAPTRSGKMVLVAAVARGATMPVLFLAHRLELIDQCAQELNLAGISNLGVIRADDHRHNPSAAVQVASIATLARREKPWLGEKIIIIVDECHRAAADSYRSLLAHWPDAIVIGFTATPARLDGKPLGDDGLFEKLEVVCTYQELLKNPEWLLAPDIFAPPVDVSQISVHAGDYDENEAAVVMDRLTGNIVDHWLRRAHMHPVFNAKGVRDHMKFVEGPRRRTFGFACNISHSLSLCSRFERAGVRVAHIDGTTPEEHRRAALRDLGSGKLEILFNVNILLEGVNVPEAKCCIHARPTKSLTLWRQSSCRVLTSWKDPVFGAIRPLILDHAGNTDRLDPPHMDWNWSLTSKPQRRAGLPPLRHCRQCYAYVEAGRSLCPHCGYEFKSSDRQQAQRPESDEELQLRNSDPGAVKRAYFDTQLAIAKHKGFKPGFASALYKEHYGEWPPRQWGAEAKADFQKDVMWQDRLQRRQKRKAAEEQAQRLEAAYMNGETREAIEILQRRITQLQALAESTHAEGERAAATNAIETVRRRIADLRSIAIPAPVSDGQAREACVTPGVVLGEALSAEDIASAWKKKAKPKHPLAETSGTGPTETLSPEHIALAWKKRGKPKPESEGRHCMQDPSVVGCCGGPGSCSCECNTCMPPDRVDDDEIERDVFTDDELPDPDAGQIDPWDAPEPAANAEDDPWYIPPDEGIPF